MWGYCESKNNHVKIPLKNVSKLVCQNGKVRQIRNFNAPTSIAFRKKFQKEHPSKVEDHCTQNISLGYPTFQHYLQARGLYQSTLPREYSVLA